jgi:hypothetical protein
VSKFFSALGLMVLLLIGLASWRGQIWTDGIAMVTPAGNLHALGVHRGHVLVLMTDIAVRPRGHGGLRMLTSSADSSDQMLETVLRNDTSVINALGVRVTSGNAWITRLAPAGNRTVMILPPWVPCLVAAALILAPAIKRRPRPGHCATCGYDLRGSRERCPECGTTFAGGGDIAAEGSATSAASCLGSG